MTDTWMGDDFFHYGAFRLSYGFEYCHRPRALQGPVGAAAGQLLRHLQLVPGPGIAQQPHEAARRAACPTWTNFTEHPSYDAFWKSRALTTWLTEVAVPTLVVGGWWDQEDFYGAVTTYATLERLDRNNRNYLVMGPWYHGSWSRGDGQKVGRHRFRERHREVLPGGDPGTVVRVLAQGQGHARPRRGNRVRERQQ